MPTTASTPNEKALSLSFIKLDIHQEWSLKLVGKGRSEQRSRKGVCFVIEKSKHYTYTKENWILTWVTFPHGPGPWRYLFRRGLFLLLLFLLVVVLPDDERYYSEIWNGKVLIKKHIRSGPIFLKFLQHKNRIKTFIKSSVMYNCISKMNKLVEVKAKLIQTWKLVQDSDVVNRLLSREMYLSHCVNPGCYFSYIVLSCVDVSCLITII